MKEIEALKVKLLNNGFKLAKMFAKGEKYYRGVYSVIIDENFDLKIWYLNRKSTVPGGNFEPVTINDVLALLAYLDLLSRQKKQIRGDVDHLYSVYTTLKYKPNKRAAETRFIELVDVYNPLHS